MDLVAFIGAPPIAGYSVSCCWSRIHANNDYHTEVISKENVHVVALNDGSTVSSHRWCARRADGG